MSPYLLLGSEPSVLVDLIGLIVCLPAAGVPMWLATRPPRRSRVVQRVEAWLATWRRERRRRRHAEAIERLRQVLWLLSKGGAV